VHENQSRQLTDHRAQKLTTCRKLIRLDLPEHFRAVEKCGAFIR
jgi:hypothetical protein